MEIPERYKVVQESDLREFQRRVNWWLAEGWSLYGDFAVNGSGVYYQVLLSPDYVTQLVTPKMVDYGFKPVANQN